MEVVRQNRRRLVRRRTWDGEPAALNHIGGLRTQNAAGHDDNRYPNGKHIPTPANHEQAKSNKTVGRQTLLHSASVRPSHGCQSIVLAQEAVKRELTRSGPENIAQNQDQGDGHYGEHDHRDQDGLCASGPPGGILGQLAQARVSLRRLMRLRLPHG